MKNITGGEVTLTGSVQGLGQPVVGTRSITIQSSLTNIHLVDILDSAGTQVVAQIAPGGNYSINIGSPQNIKIKGYNGEIVYIAMVTL